MKKWYTSSESKTPTCVLQVLHTTGKNVSSALPGGSASPPPLPPPLPPLPPRAPRPPCAQPCRRQAAAQQGAKAKHTRLSARGAQPLVALHHAVAHEHSSELGVVPRVPASQKRARQSPAQSLPRGTVCALLAVDAHGLQTARAAQDGIRLAAFALLGRPLLILRRGGAQSSPSQSGRALLRAARETAAPYRLAPRRTTRRRRLRLLLRLRERAASRDVQRATAARQRAC